MKIAINLLIITFTWLVHSIGQSPQLPCGVALEEIGQEAQMLNYEEFVRIVGYPEEALEKKIEGTVILYLEIDSLGRVSSFDVPNRDKVDPLLSMACIMHSRKLKFSPALDTLGNPIRFCVNLPLTFSLEAFSQLHYLQAVTYSLQNSYRDAHKHYDLALEVDKENLPATIMKGVSYLHIGTQYPIKYFHKSSKLIKQLKNENPEKWEFMRKMVVKPIPLIDTTANSSKKDKEGNVMGRQALSSLGILLGLPTFHNRPPKESFIYVNRNPKQSGNSNSDEIGMFSPIWTLQRIREEAENELLIYSLDELLELLEE